MKIRYKIEGEDAVAFNVQHICRLPKIRRLQLRDRIIISALYGLIAIGLFIYEPLYWPFAWLLMFGGIVCFLFYPKVCERRIRTKISRTFKNKEYGMYELELTSEGIFAKNDIKEGYIHWAGVKKIIKNDQHVFLYLTEDDAIIIPKDGIEADASWEDLNDCINQFSQK